MPRTYPTVQLNEKRKGQVAVGVILLLLLGGCQSMSMGDDGEGTTSNCAMALAAAAGPREFIGGGGNGGGGITSGGWGDGGSSSTSGGPTTGGSVEDIDIPEYEPGMKLDEITPDMEAEAETAHGEMRAVGTKLIWFDKRTNEAFPWEKRAHDDAKREADAVDSALAALEDC